MGGGASERPARSSSRMCWVSSYAPEAAPVYEQRVEISRFWHIRLAFDTVESSFDPNGHS
jgi:hypothetical protein